jgi:putative inorganic carbon (HCO3(-)) transporter
LFPSQIPLLTFFALIATAFLWLWPLFRRKKVFPYTPFNGAILIFGIAILLGIIVTADYAVTLSKTTGIILGLTAWRYVVLTVEDRFSLSAVVGVFLLIGLGFIGLGILSANWTVKVPILEPILKLLPSRLITPPEAPTTGVSANQLAGVLLFYLPLFLSLGADLRFARGQRWLRPLFLVVAILLSGWLVMTQSRAGWIGGMAGIVTMLFMWYLLIQSSKKRRLILVLLIAMIGILAVGVFVIASARFGNIWNEPTELTVVGGVGTINFRFEVWKWAIAAIQDFPFTGTGLGSFRYVVGRLYPINVRPDFDISHAHNIFLQMGLDTGLPGLIAYLSILIIAFTLGWRAAKKNTEVRSLAIGLLSALTALHVYGMYDALALGSKPALVFWIALGLLVAIDKMDVTNSGKTGTPFQ